MRWYEGFFEGVTPDLWAKAVSAEQTRLEADFLERVLGLHPGAEVLDVPCGLGRHSIELASRSHSMTAVDVSAEAIERAPDLAAAERALVDDILFLEDTRYRLLGRCLGTGCTLIQDGRSTTRTGLHWIYTVGEIRGLLEQTGLAVESVSGSLDGAPFGVGSPYLLLVARKS